MCRLLAVLALLLLAACQAQSAAPNTAAAQPAVGGGQSSSAEKMPGDWGDFRKTDRPPSKFFAYEVENTKRRMMVTLVQDCFDQLQNKPGLDRCVRNDMVKRFDDSGQGAAKCARQSDLDAYATCVVVGNVSIDLIRRLDPEASIDEDIWDSPRAFGEMIDKVAISNAIAHCSGETTELGATECAFDWVLSRAQLPERLAKKCAPDLVSTDRTACIGEAATIRFIDEHLAPGTSA